MRSRLRWAADLIGEVLAGDFHIDHMEVAKRFAFVFQLQDGGESVLHVALENVLPVLQPLGQLRKRGGESRRAFWIEVAFEILLILSNKVNVLVHSLRREAGLADPRELLLERLRNLGHSGGGILVAAVQERVDHSQEPLLRQGHESRADFRQQSLQQRATVIRSLVSKALQLEKKRARRMTGMGLSRQLVPWMCMKLPVFMVRSRSMASGKKIDPGLCLILTREAHLIFQS